MAKYLLIDSRDNKAITDVRTSTKYTYASIAYYKGAKTPYLGIPITTSRISNFQEYLNIKYGSGSQVSEFINLGGFDDSLPSRAILVVYKVRTNIPFALDLVKQINSETILRCSFAVFLTINDDF